MATVQIWNGSTWIDFYTLPNATSNTLGGVKIGNNITVSNGTISLTKNNVTSALGYTPLSLSGGTMTGNISYQGTKSTYSMIKWIDNTADTYGNGIRIGGGGATIIGGGESADLPSVSGGDEILYLMNDGNIDFYSNCQNGLDSAKHMSFDTSGNLNVPNVRASGNIYEGGTLLSNKYLGINTKDVVRTSGNQDVGGDKTFNGSTTIDSLTLTTTSGAPTINVYNTQNVSGYLVSLPYNNGLDCTIASTADLSNYQPLDADLTSIAGLSGTSGLLKKTAANTWSLDTTSYSLASHTHTSLKSNTDNRSTNTIPNNYNSVFNIAGLKTNSAIGLDASTYGDYSCLMGVRGWSDSSGGNTHEIALTGNGYLMHRHGATTSWNGWKRIAYTSDIPGIATKSAAGLMSSTDKTKLDGIATGATKVTTDTVSGWGYTKNTGTVTQVKVGTTAYNPSSGVVSLPAYPAIPTSLKNPNSITIKAGNDTVSSYDGSAAKTFTLAASTTAGAFTVSDGTTTKTIQLAGKFTDNNTWRPVVDNLTSTDTDKSLSANQGKVLKGLVDGKAASDHKHSQYLTSHLYRPIKIKDTTTVIGNTSSTALNLKEGTNISLSHDGNGGITISSTASGGGGGLTCTQVFEGAGDRSGQYHQAGSWSTKINIVSQGYKLLIFYLDVNDYKFPCCAQVPASSFTYYLRYTCSSYDGSVTVVDITYSDSEFTAEKLSGSGTLYNVDIYAYK